MSEWRVIDRGGQRDIVGEGLLWSPSQGAIFWTDLVAPAVWRLSFLSGEVQSWTMPEMVCWLIERHGQSGFIAGFQSGFKELSLDPLTIIPILHPEPHLPVNRLNDAKADKWGHIWAGTMPIAMDSPSGGLYRLNPDRSVCKVDEGYQISNGPAISPDHRWLYHADTVAGLIYRFPLAEEGVGPREIFIRFDKAWGSPDGMTVDTEGGLWVAHWGGARVSRFKPDGELDRVIALPASQITNVVFAGEQLDRMFVTSASIEKQHEPLAGALFEVDTGGVCGLVAEKFGG